MHPTTTTAAVVQRHNDIIATTAHFASVRPNRLAEGCEVCVKGRGAGGDGVIGADDAEGAGGGHCNAHEGDWGGGE